MLGQVWLTFSWGLYSGFLAGKGRSRYKELRLPGGKSSGAKGSGQAWTPSSQSFCYFLSFDLECPRGSQQGWHKLGECLLPVVLTAQSSSPVGACPTAAGLDGEAWLANVYPLQGFGMGGAGLQPQLCLCDQMTWVKFLKPRLPL